jgi:hypothetical protein
LIKKYDLDFDPKELGGNTHLTPMLNGLAEPAPLILQAETGPLDMEEFRFRNPGDQITQAAMETEIAKRVLGRMRSVRAQTLCRSFSMNR